MYLYICIVIFLLSTDYSVRHMEMEMSSVVTRMCESGSGSVKWPFTLQCHPLSSFH